MGYRRRRGHGPIDLGPSDVDFMFHDMRIASEDASVLCRVWLIQVWTAKFALALIIAGMIVALNRQFSSCLSGPLRHPVGASH